MWVAFVVEFQSEDSAKTCFFELYARYVRNQIIDSKPGLAVMISV
jgi:hypothetical protein